MAWWKRDEDSAGKKRMNNQGESSEGTKWQKTHFQFWDKGNIPSILFHLKKKNRWSENIAEFPTKRNTKMSQMHHQSSCFTASDSQTYFSKPMKFLIFGLRFETFVNKASRGFVRIVQQKICSAQRSQSFTGFLWLSLCKSCNNASW